MSRKTTDEEIRKTIAMMLGISLEEFDSGSLPHVRGHIDFYDCAVWFDENGYKVEERTWYDSDEIWSED